MEQQTGGAISGAVECGAYKCDFTFGTGIGGSYRKLGAQRGRECMHACVHMKALDPSINGVTVGKSGCYCKQNMTKIDGLYKTCFLKSDFNRTPLPAFTKKNLKCRFQPGDGSGTEDLYIGKLDRESCIIACIHMKKIDNTVNGVTVYANSSRLGCWCEKGVRNVRASRTYYNTCIFEDTSQKKRERKENQTSFCNFSYGYASGDLDHAAYRSNKGYIGKMSAAECIEGCVHMKRIDPTINGAMRSNITERCWCERGMKNIAMKMFCNA